MRNLFAFLIAMTFIDHPGALLAQNTIPVPLPAPALSLQGFSNCTSSCSTQAGACQGSCLSLGSGLITSSGTVLGSTSNQTQCSLNCTSQQLLCQQSCPGSP